MSRYPLDNYLCCLFVGKSLVADAVGPYLKFLQKELLKNSCPYFPLLFRNYR